MTFLPPKLLLALTLLWPAGLLIAQEKSVDTLRLALSKFPAHSKDTAFIRLKVKLGERETISRSAYWDSLTAACEAGLRTAKAEQLALFYKKQLCACYAAAGLIQRRSGNFDPALQHYRHQHRLSLETKDPTYIVNALHNIAAVHGYMKKTDEALAWFRKAVHSAEASGNKALLTDCLDKLGKACSFCGKYDEAIAAFTRAIAVNDGTGNISAKLQLLNRLARTYKEKGEIEKAIVIYEKALKESEAAGDKEWLSSTLNNVALIYENKGDVMRALEYYLRCMRIAEENKDAETVGTCLNNMGLLYKTQGEYGKAYECFNTALGIFEKSEDKEGIGYSCINLGALLDRHGDPACSSAACRQASIAKALACYERALRLREELGDKKGIAFCLNTLGTFYMQHGDVNAGKAAPAEGRKKAEQYLNRCLEMHRSIGNKKGLTGALNNVARLHLLNGKTSEAEKSALQALQLAKELGFPENIMGAAETLKNIYKRKGDHDAAYGMFSLEVKMRDSLQNESTRKASIRSQLKYEYSKKAAADSVARSRENELKNARLEQQQAELKARNNQQYALFGGIALLLVAAGFIYKRFRITQKQRSIIEKQKRVVEEQKHLLEEKQNEIIDSIFYARRIQRAHLPTEAFLSRKLKQLRERNA